MATAREDQPSVRVAASNLGGISSTEVTIEPGVNILAGRNATNRTSLLRAVMGALGSDAVALKSDADAGEVRLQIGDESYSRALEREGRTVVSGGDPYLEDPTLADLFAFLVATNPSRQAVLREGDLRALIMRPVDTEGITAEIERLRTRRDAIDDRLDAISAEADRLPAVETRLAATESQQGDVDGEIAKLREELASMDEENAETDAELDEAITSLGETRTTLERLRRDAETVKQAIDDLQARESELEEADSGSTAELEMEIETIESEIAEARRRRTDLQTQITSLHQIIQFNEENLQSPETLSATGGGGGAVTDGLTGTEEQVTCWTCGQGVSRTDIEGTIDQLRSLRREHLEENRGLETRIRELEADRDERQQALDAVTDQADELADVRASIAAETDRLDRIHEQIATYESDVTRLETVVESKQNAQNEDLLTLHRELNELAVTREQLEATAAELAEEIEDIESAVAERSPLEDEREEVTEAITGARNRIERLETETVTAFNEHMAAVLDVLEYRNLSRVWIERVEPPAARAEAQFELHIVREGADGRAYEDIIDHLSESEREVIGLVFALAGYLVHEVHEVLPFMLLDSLEAIDSDRIARLLAYLEPYATYLVAALLPEDASAVEDARIIDTV
jgi:DNA repair exonuclease SbcCD ATPase subunit